MEPGKICSNCRQVRRGARETQGTMLMKVLDSTRFVMMQECRSDMCILIMGFTGEVITQSM